MSLVRQLDLVAYPSTKFFLDGLKFHHLEGEACTDLHVMWIRQITSDDAIVTKIDWLYVVQNVLEYTGCNAPEYPLLYLLRKIVSDEAIPNVACLCDWMYQSQPSADLNLQKLYMMRCLKDKVPFFPNPDNLTFREMLRVLTIYSDLFAPVPNIAVLVGEVIETMLRESPIRPVNLCDPADEKLLYEWLFRFSYIHDFTVSHFGEMPPFMRLFMPFMQYWGIMRTSTLWKTTNPDTTIMTDELDEKIPEHYRSTFNKCMDRLISEHNGHLHARCIRERISILRSCNQLIDQPPPAEIQRECGICLDKPVNVIIGCPSHHISFCAGCIAQWIQEDQNVHNLAAFRCPKCKGEFHSVSAIHIG
jgi:hypothetical protein